MKQAFIIAAAAGLGVGGAALAGGPPEGELLIVAPRALMEAVRPYAAQRRDLRAEVVELEGVLAASAGADDPERLKRYLYGRWTGSKHALNYVLLVGDADVMPVRYMVLDRVTPPAFDYAFYPSDLYYADLAKADGSFEDWNAQKGRGAPGAGEDGAFHAGYFGEVRGEKNKADPINYDQIDYKPEIGVGRWPVDTPEEVNTIAAKSMAYTRRAQALVLGSGRSMPLATVVATGGWMENRPLMDQMAGRLIGPWDVMKLYWSGPGHESADLPDEAHVLDAINAGVVLILHSGHGSDNSWDGSIHTGSISKMKNAEFPCIMMSAGCSTARLATLPPYEPYTDVDGKDHAGTNAGEVFTAPPPPPAPYQKGPHNPSGLGEQLLRAGPTGAAAYIGCNTGSQPCGMTLMEGLIDTLAAEQAAGRRPRLGDSWMGAVSYYYDHEGLATLKATESWYPASIFFQGMKFMLFGDPSLPMPGSASESPR